MPILLTSGTKCMQKNIHEILHFNSDYVVTVKILRTLNKDYTTFTNKSSVNYVQ